MEGVAVELGVDGDGGDPQLAAGADDPDGDLAAVGDQDLLEHAAPFGQTAVWPPTTGTGRRAGAHVAAVQHWSRPVGCVPCPAAPGSPTSGGFAEIDSTNRYLLDEARAGAPEGVVAVADHQTRGPGPPRAALGGAAGVQPAGLGAAAARASPSSELHLCTVAVAPGRRRRRRRRDAGLEPELKWPNDLMVGDAQAGRDPGRGRTSTAGGAGPAAEPRLPVVVVGLGLNVAWPPEPTATSRAELARTGHLAAARDRRRAGGRAVELLDARRSTAARAPGSSILGDRRRAVGAGWSAEYRRRLRHRRDARSGSSLPGETFTGTATDITVEGHLVVDVGACLRTVAAGDVVHLRS